MSINFRVLAVVEEQYCVQFFGKQYKYSSDIQGTKIWKKNLQTFSELIK